MLFGMMAKQLLILRPDVSQYQGQNFRDIEKKALESNSQTIYIQNIDELENYPQDSELIVISTSQTNTELLNKRLKNRKVSLWIHPNSGYDNLSQEFVKESDFPIVVGNNIRANAVYLYSVQCFLDSMGPIPFSKSWKSDRSFPRKSLNQESVLVIGKGHIGSKFCAFLESANFDFQTLDPFKGHVDVDYSKVSSVVVLASLNLTSKNMLDDNFFSKLKKNVNIINPARGKLIDEEALIKYMKSSPDSKIYLDVFEKEPCDFEKFLFHKSINLSSHIAGVYNDIDQVIIDHEFNVINDFKNTQDSVFKAKYFDLILKNKITDGILI